jgi:hypothetical protein
MHHDSLVRLEQVEPGFVRKSWDVEYSWRIAKKVLKPLAMANWFLFVEL